MIKVTIWNEFRHEKSSERVKAIYPNGLHAAIKEYLDTDEELEVRLAALDDEDQGLPDEVLNDTDVLLWWGHWYHGKIRDDIADKVVLAVNKGMGFMALHSAHHCKPFKKLMGTGCHLSWREMHERERIWVIDDTHPITQGLPTNFVIPHEEMYGEPFDIPTPDELFLLGWFQGGEVMRSGAAWKRGRGKVVFLQPGHETNPTYWIDDIRTALKNAVEYLRPVKKVTEYLSPHVPSAPEGVVEITEWPKN